MAIVPMALAVNMGELPWLLRTRATTKMTIDSTLVVGSKMSMTKLRAVELPQEGGGKARLERKREPQRERLGRVGVIVNDGVKERLKRQAQGVQRRTP